MPPTRTGQPPTTGFSPEPLRDRIVRAAPNSLSEKINQIEFPEAVMLHAAVLMCHTGLMDVSGPPAMCKGLRDTRREWRTQKLG